MDVKIENGIGIPERRVRAKNRKKSTLDKILSMKVGESFSVPSSQVKLARSHAKAVKRKYNDFNYTTRKTEDGGLRVWRIVNDILSN